MATLILIFDFDGTLADTFPLVAQITTDLTGQQPISNERMKYYRAEPLLTAVKDMGGHWWRVPKLALLVRRHMLRRMKEVKLFGGVPQMLQELYENGNRLMILSSNNVNNIQEFLRSYGLDKLFTGRSVYHCRVFNKSGGLKSLMRHARLEKEKCVYIGNETLDVCAARKAGVRSVAVGWSGANQKVLAEAEPDYISQTPAELVSCLRKLQDT
jgi:phosphoglycolate phosphatase